jgi:ferritin-like metal-binding protein YciE
LLEETLEEEKETDEKLTELAKQINVQAGKAVQSDSAGAQKKGKRVA